jgi:leucyl aminopeptidase (aminopeptidase T)
MYRNITKTITNIYKINLNVKKNERVIIFTDDVNKKIKDIARRIAKEGKEYTKKINYIEYEATGSHGVEPPELLWIKAFGKNTVKEFKVRGLLKPLLNKKASKNQLRDTKEIIRKFKEEAVNVVIALSYYSTTHTQFRQLLTKICRARYASMPLFEEEMLNGAMKVNWKEMAKRTKKIAERMNKAESIEIKTSKGTYLSFSKKGRKAKADTGILTKKGTCSNLPAGEAFLAPLEGTANGKLILEWAPTRKLKSPITLRVKDGMVVEVAGNEEYVDFLKKKFSERVENANIAELGIGTNDRASRPDNILESEKILGTIHIALGDNSSFGGKISTPFHQDFVFFKPTVVLIHKDGKRDILLKDGRLMV